MIQEQQGSANIRMTNIKTLTYNQTYEVVIIGNDLQPHPWHIHGFWLDFLEAGSIVPYVSTNYTDECDQTILDISQVSRLLDALPGYDQPRTAVGKGDTFMVPGFGYVVFRFKANNAGPWFFHCHIEWHMAMGMAMLFSVENTPGIYNIYEPIGFPSSCIPFNLQADTTTSSASNVVLTWILGPFLVLFSFYKMM